MQKPLAGLNAAILIANGFNEIEMTVLQRALLEAGASPKIISTEPSLAHGWQDKGWGHYHPVDKHLSDALAADYDLLILPSGYRGHDKLKQTAHTRRFIRGFMMGYKPVLALGDAVKLMAELEMAAGHLVAADPTVASQISGVATSEISPTVDSNLMTMISLGEDKQASVAAFTDFILRHRAEQAAAAADDDAQQAA